MGGDSGELVAEACHLGTAHPPGYPLFTLLFHVITQRTPGAFSHTTFHGTYLRVLASQTLLGRQTQQVLQCYRMEPKLIDLPLVFTARANLLNALFGTLTAVLFFSKLTTPLHDLLLLGAHRV